MLTVHRGYLLRPQRNDCGSMNAPNKEFALAGSLEELKSKGRLVVYGGHRPILVIYDPRAGLRPRQSLPTHGLPAEEDFRTNVEAEHRIEALQKSLAAIESNKLDRIIEILEAEQQGRCRDQTRFFHVSVPS